MEMLILYLFIGFLLSSSFLMIIDFHPWKLFAILCIIWLPFIIVGTMIASFMDIEKISNKLNT
jgi:hypothetical protein